MRKNYALSIKFIFLFLLFAGVVSAQSVVRGKVTGDQATMQGVSVSVKGGEGTITDATGNYSIKLGNGLHTVTFSLVGFKKTAREITVSGADVILNVVLESSASQLGEVVVSTGSRSAQRTITDSPIPIDIIASQDLLATGQSTFDKALEYKVPSFNTVMTPVNDATSLLDPYEIRNMGPSRTLVLINGKRKNSSALTYIQQSPGRGESGADISAIPIDAIKRVEIVRDGASAQYGSDAIAGVMNIILKDRFNYGSFTLNTGITGHGDGQHLGFALNNGANFGDKGYINYTIDFSYTTLANRAGKVSAIGEEDPNTGFGAPASQVLPFLAQFPDAKNVNGSPENSAAKFLVNGGIPIGGNTEFYYNAAYVYKKVNSFANYRTPYWKGDNGLLHDPTQPYVGFGPTFQGDLNDYNGTVGFRSTQDGWKTDVSFTTGGNKQLYTVSNTVNESLGTASPISFKPGGFSFTNNVGNIDITKQVSDKVSVAAGSEFRVENYQIIAGDTASYSGSGAVSFPGYSSRNAIVASRYNLGGYVDVNWDITRQFLIDGTVREEKYSDFGDAFVWKLSSRYKFLNDKVTIRSSLSTGFRAPSISQINLQLAQASFAGGTIQTQGIVSNTSPEARLLGVPKLRPEKSTNFTAGLGLNPTDNLNITFDYYNIRVNNRIVLSANIGPGTGPGSANLNSVLAASHITKVSFFTNGLDSRTQGLDFVANYRNIALGRGKLSFNVAGNYTLQNANLRTINPPLIAAAGKSVITAEVQELLLNSRPKFKYIIGADYHIGKLLFSLNETIVGPTTFHDADNELNDNLNTKFVTKGLTDFNFSVPVARNLSLNAGVQNIFNAVPHFKLVALNAAGQAVLADPAQVQSNINGVTFNGRYPLTGYNGSQFSQLGTTFSASLTLKF